MASVAVAYQFTVPGSVDQTHDEILTAASPRLANLWKYKVTGDTGSSITFTRTYIPTWAMVLGVLGLLVFLIGILFFFIKNEDILVFSLSPHGNETKVTVTGSGPPQLTDYLKGLGDPVRVGDAQPAAPAIEQSSTPAGWFPDSTDAGRLRWWDGSEWTDSYHEVETPPAPPPA